MKKIFILLFTILIIGCSKNDNIIKVRGSKFFSIIYQSEFDNWKANYFYDSDNRIIQIDDFFSLGRKYEIEYENNRLKQYTTYQITNARKVFRDSILYNSDWKIESIYHFSINSSANLTLAWVYKYEYNSSGKLSKKITFYLQKEKYATVEKSFRIEKYYWKDNNVVKVEECDANELLEYEFIYTYDNMQNYKKNNPIYIEDPINWSDNNIVEMIWYDYVGNLDIICRPCESTYTYNLDGYPIKIETNWGRKMLFIYE